MVGYKEILEAIRGAAKFGTLAHAHLIYGEDGIGKSKLALEMARLILNPLKPYEKKVNVDIKEIRLKGNSIGVDEVRDIVMEANFKPFSGHRKVIIIYDGDRMTVQAQNALLKTIEEPPYGVYFIILSKSRDSLLPTIRSRCQNIRLYPLSREDMEEYIKTNYTIAEEKIEELVLLSQGIPGRVDDFLKDEKTRNRINSLLAFLDALSKILSIKDKNAPLILSYQKLMLEDPIRHLEDLIALIRDLSIIKGAKHYKNLIFLYNEKRMVEVASRYTMTRLVKIFEAAMEGLKLLEPRRNINKETVVDYVLLKMLEDN